MSGPDEAGYALMHDPRLNRGTAFTAAQRRAHGLEGLLPPVPSTLEHQVARTHAELSNLDNDLQKYLFLSDLQARNETLFYKTLMSDPARFVPKHNYASEGILPAWQDTSHLPGIRSDENPNVAARWMKAVGKLPD